MPGMNSIAPQDIAVVLDDPAARIKGSTWRTCSP